MKKNPVYFLLTAVAIVAVTITACKKSADQQADLTAVYTVQSDDQSRFSTEVDAVSNDANTAIEATPSFDHRSSTTSLICDATIAIDSNQTTKSITITYNGNNCFGTRTRTGVVVISMPASVKWSDAGAAVTVSYQNLKVTRVIDNKSITLNGTITATNVSGGRLSNLANLASITHTITSDGMTITFDDGKQRSWQVAEQRVFTYNNGIVISISGTHTDGDVTHIAEWGLNRFGSAFNTSTEEPIVIRQDCSFRVVSGKLVHNKLDKPLTLTFGLNANGEPTTCPATGGYYFKAEWTGLDNVAHSLIMPY